MTESDSDQDQTLALLLPLLILLTTLLLLLLLFLLFLIVVRRKNRTGQIQLRDSIGPTNLEFQDSLDATLETNYLQSLDPLTAQGYSRAKDWQTQYPPNSQPTDITLTQFLSIQEKGVSAWSFEPDYEQNQSLYVQARTEITFLADGIGMAQQEGGGTSTISNLPIPRLNEVYYWEAKMYDKPAETTVAIGLATKPFPSFRLPGWNKYSVGYFSSDGYKSHSYPFTSTAYGPALSEGDVLGVGYRPRTGTVFFTRNGKKLEDAFIGFNKYNVFPIVGANGRCSIHVNFGQAGFVFIEANVKKWGLAPMLGTLAPPPAYGSERGSILLESNGRRSQEPSSSTRTLRPSSSTSESSSSGSTSTPTVSSGTITATAAAASLSAPISIQNRPAKPSPLRHSRQVSTSSTSHQQHLSSNSSSISSARRSRPALDANSMEVSEGGESEPNREQSERENPPTPSGMDISLRSLHAFPRMEMDDEAEAEAEQAIVSPSTGSDSGEGGDEEVVQERVVLPPGYATIDPHMYAPGVAESILSDAFASTTSPHPNFANHFTTIQPPLLPFSTHGIIPFSPFSASGGSGNGSSYESQSRATTAGGTWMSWLRETTSTALGGARTGAVRLDDHTSV